VEGGVLGVVQPIMDGFKLVFKEVVIPNNSILIIFIVSPILAFCLGFAS
jgi:NADH:ubiquinone oxidoreductase subunit H